MAPRVKKADKLTALMNANMDKIVGVDDVMSKPASASTKQEGSVGKFYFKCLEKHQKELGKDKVTVMMQVGSFYEVYGYIKADGTRVGNVWDVADDANMAAVPKSNQKIFEPENELYMAGTKIEYVNKVIDKLVDECGWTIAIYDQKKIGNSHTRELKNIISPGLNFENDNISNVLMYVYIKSYKNRIDNCQSINYGVYYIDCISGGSGVIELFSRDANNISVELSELLKVITIQNPKEMVIHLDIISCVKAMDIPSQLSKSELYTNLALYERNVKFIGVNDISVNDDGFKSGVIDKKYERIEYQRHQLERVYPVYKSNTDILIQLGLTQYDFARIAICLGIEYVNKHNSAIINNLTHLDIGHNRADYLMLANNCLYQLDVLNSDTKFRSNGSERFNGVGGNVIRDNMININKVSLIDILNNTKTVIGSRKIRKLISMPITNINELENRYNNIDNWIKCQQDYLLKNNDNDNNITLSPLNKIRGILGGIRDIPKYMRKLAACALLPNELDTIITSFKAISDLYNLVVEEYNLTSVAGTEKNNKKEWVEAKKVLGVIINEMTQTFIMETCSRFWCNIETNIFKKGFDTHADLLQNNVNMNANILNYALVGFQNYIIEKNIAGKLIDKFKYRINTLGKYGKHIYINTDFYKFLTTNPLVGGNDYIILKNEDGESLNKIRISDIEFINHKKNYYIINCEIITRASNSLDADIENLISYTKKRFVKYQKDFYENYKFIIETINGFVEWCDITQCATYNAIKYGHSRPVITGDPENVQEGPSYFKAKNIRHPIVEFVNPNGYIPNDIELGNKCKQNGILLYGPNAAGKSTMSKSVGIAIIMAQAGFFVACDSMEFKPYHYLFTRIKNNDNIHAGLSSFQVESRELKVITDYCDKNSIVLGDEILNSTNTIEATALMASALIKLHNTGCNFMFATHLHNLTRVKAINDLKRLSFYHMAVLQDPNNPNEITYNRKMIPGSGPRSYAILICKNMKFDDEFIEMAYKIRSDIETGNLEPVKEDVITNSLIEVSASKYNSAKIVDKCQVCGANAVDVHHISEQNTADLNGFIRCSNINSSEQVDNRTFHKNQLRNLVSLCKQCHQSVHSVPQRLMISGYSETINGMKLNFKWLNQVQTSIPNDNPPEYVSVVNEISSESSLSDFNPDEDPDEIELEQIIQNLKNQGKTIKSIQYSLRKQYNMRLKLVDIERYYR